MATGRDFPLSLTIKAVDNATGTLRKVQAQIAQATAPIRGVGAAAKNVGTELMSSVARMGALAAGAGFAFFQIAKGAMESGDKLSEMAERVGLGVDAYASLRYAAAQSDVDAEQFNSSMDKFNKNLGLMRANSGPIVEFLSKVGPGLLKQMKGAHGTAEALGLMTKAFEEVKDPQRRAALAAEIFGKSGLQMGQWLGKGQGEIDRLVKNFERLHGSSKEFADNSSDLDNATKDLGVAFDGLRDSAAGALFPALTQLATGLTNVLAGNRGKLKEWAEKTGKAISDWVSGGGIDRLVKGLGDLANGIGKVIDFFGGFRNTAIAVIAVMNTGLIVSVFELIGALAKLGWAVGSFVVSGLMTFIPWAASWVKYLWMMRASLMACLGPTLAAAAPFIAVAAAVGAVSLAVYELVKNWSTLKEMWKDGNTLKAVGDMLGHPLDALGTAKDFYFGKSGSALNPSAAAPPPAGAPGAGGEAKVTVDFVNMPKGARVTQDKSGNMLLDLLMGVPMLGGS